MSEHQPQPYIVVEKHGSGFAAFVWGALVGAGAALLLAPRSGEETQRELREGARRFREGAGEKLTELRGTLEESGERAREEVEERVTHAREQVRDQKHRAEEALKAGKEAARQARSDLERRVAESKAQYKQALAKEEENGAAEPADVDEEAEGS